MSERPLVSVIIPVYNTEEFLPLCMETVLGQTWREMEILLVDDGSAPACAALCDEYAARDGRVRVIHKANAGAAAARNTALDAMTGEYVTFVDSDDYIALDMVEALMELALAHDADMASSRGIYTTRRELFPVEQPPLEIWEGEGRAVLYRLASWRPAVWPKVYRKKLFDGIRFPETRIYEDDGITVPLLWDCGKIVYTNQRYYYYYLSENSIMRAPFAKKRFDMLKVFSLRRDFYRQHGAEELEERNAVDWYLHLYRLRCDMRLDRWPERKQYLPMLADQEKELSWVRKSRFFTPQYKVKRLVLKYFPHLAGIYFRRKALSLITDK